MTVWLQTQVLDPHSRILAGMLGKTVVRTPGQLREMIAVLEQAPVFAFDTETSGLRYYRHSRICGMSFAARVGGELRSWYVPYRHKRDANQLPVDVVHEATRDLLTRPLVAHNAKFDWHMVRAEGLDFGPEVHDTMIMAALVDENRSLALKDRAAVDLGEEAAHAFEGRVNREIQDLARQCGLGVSEYKERFGYSHLPVDLAGIYACYDAEFTLRLHELWSDYRHRYAEVYRRETDLLPVLVEMEENGLPVDVDYVNELRETTARAQEAIASEIFSDLGFQFSLSSDDELRDVLTRVLGCRLTKLTAAGRKARDQLRGDVDPRHLAVDREVLDSLVYQHPVVSKIISWRQAQKIRTTYTDGILRSVGDDGCVHGSFRQVGTKTGRLSAADPNLQNFAGDDRDRAQESEDGHDPWSVKRAFVNRGGEWARGYFDYSQIELRVLAYYSRDPTMLDVYRRGLDIHERTRVEVFGEHGKRRDAKIVNFGLCVAEGSLVLTDRGLVPIERVTTEYRVWDGRSWVQHDGVVFRGEEEVITHDGVTATPDHEVYTEDGDRAPIWKLALGVVGGRIATGGVGGSPVRYLAYDRKRPNAGRWTPRAEGEGVGAELRRCSAVLREGYARFLAQLQGAWDQGFVRVAGTSCALGPGEIPRHRLQGSGFRPDRQRRALPPRQLEARNALRKSIESKTARVYDILNAGPRRRYTVDGKIVSNSYCLSSAGFSRQAKIPLDRAEAFMDEFFRKYPRIAPFREEFWAQVRRDGGYFENVFGRPRRVPAILNVDGRTRSSAQRRAIGSLIQGTAAELTKISLVRLWRWNREHDLGLRLVTTIHDEIQIDIPVDRFHVVAPAVKHIMEDFPELAPLRAETDVEVSTTNWSDKGEWDGKTVE